MKAALHFVLMGIYALVAFYLSKFTSALIGVSTIDVHNNGAVVYQCLNTIDYVRIHWHVLDRASTLLGFTAVYHAIVLARMAGAALHTKLTPKN
jgi:hypothetical protein